MRITCHHPQSSNGIPVILDDNGKVMPYPKGLTAALKAIGWDRHQLATSSGYKSARSIEKFWQGHVPSAQLLNVLRTQLELMHGHHQDETG